MYTRGSVKRTHLDSAFCTGSHLCKKRSKIPWGRASAHVHISTFANIQMHTFTPLEMYGIEVSKMSTHGRGEHTHLQAYRCTRLYFKKAKWILSKMFLVITMLFLGRSDKQKVVDVFLGSCEIDSVPKQLVHTVMEEAPTTAPRKR